MNQEPITSLKGIGEKTGALFQKLGIETVDDLLHDYPRGYDSYEPPTPIESVREGEIVAVSGVLLKTASVRRFKQVELTLASVKDRSGVMQLTWYHMPYLRATLQMGKRFVFRGKVVKKGSRLELEQPEIFSLEDYERVMGSMRPVYGQTKGLGNKAIVRAMEEAFARRTMEREYLPEDLRSRYELAEYNYALEHIHFPADRAELLMARKRLVFDEFFFFLLAVRRLKEKRQDQTSAFVMHHAEEVDALEARLPYALTSAQKRTLTEVQRDLESGLVMNRLVQGDVGSGKTVIAILALLQTAYNGFQGALMAPTEVLARQHFESMQELFEKWGVTKQVVLVTGSMTAKEKREAYKKIASHEADIIVGTHALIQENVHYDKLALVITDEQHRFGVRQRETFAGKGTEPHVLVMSATPIPRTLAIIIYGDLDISVIDEVPAKRLPIKNCVVDRRYRPKAYAFIEHEIREGHQAYVICPLVEESENMEAENVTDYAKRLREELPEDIVIGVLHGQMKAEQKNKIMDQFVKNEIQVLVSTTVVEVGVNVPNATVMMIENAERFGLAQLHQLRGRVGRGDAQSYCIMVNASDSKNSMKRLDILNKSNDGFKIASEDLKLRGPGDFFGIRQSGEMQFLLADIYQDASVLQQASEEVQDLLATDPEQCEEENINLQHYLEIFFEDQKSRLNL